MFETEDTKLCRGCLSTDRKLTSVSAGDLKLYYSLLAEDRKLDVLSIPGLDLCWECVALLHRIQIFRARVQQAHTILEDSLGLPTGKDTLSSLNIQQKIEYDDIFEETEPIDQPWLCKTKVPDITVEKIVIPTKYKALVTEIAKNLKDESNDDLITIDCCTDIDTGNMSDDDDSDDHENVDTCDRHSSSPEITIKKITPQKKLPDVKPIKHSNLNDEKLKGKAELQVKRVFKNRPVKYTKHTKHAPAIVKTPVIAKLELELQKLMQNAKNSAQNVTTQQSTSKQRKTKKKSTTSNENAGSSKELQKLKRNAKNSAKNLTTQQNTSKQRKTKKESTTSNENAGSSNDIAVSKKYIYRENESESSAEEDAHESNKKRFKPDVDPDFNLGKDNSDSDQSKSEKDGPKENLDDGEKEKIMKKKRFVKTTIRQYKHIDDVLSCFTEIEMSVDNLKSYLEKQDAIVDEKKPHHCSICGQRFTLHRCLTRHAQAYHKATHRALFRKGSFYNPPLSIPDKPCLWRCSVCTTMVRREHILAHMNARHRTQYFCNGQGCEWSMKGFWIKEDHVEHWDAIHKQFACDICGKRKSKKSAMELHIMEAHLRIPQQCPHCPRAYGHRAALLQHLAHRHPQPEPAEHRYCVECDVTFNTVASLQKHFYTKHNEARTKYPCPDCGRVLATRSSYQNHYSLFHTGKTNYRCHVCGKYFSKSQALEGHLKTHLNIKLPKDKPCTICGRKFQTNRILRQHMYTHTGERPYACPHCDAAYTQPYCLQVHLARRHGVLAPVRHLPGKRVATTTITQDDQ